MKDTGKKLTYEQIQIVKDKLNTPVMYLSGGEPIGGRETPQQLVHKFARGAGLPEISGYYGADLRDGTIYEV